MKKRMLKAAAFLLVTGGLLTALYPSIRNFGNGFTQSKAIHDYQEAVGRDDFRRPGEGMGPGRSI